MMRGNHMPSIHVPRKVAAEGGTAAAQIRHVVVPLDGSMFAEQAIPVALDLAEQSGAGLRLVHVVVASEVLDPFDVLTTPGGAIASVKGAKKHYLQEIAGLLANRSSVGITVRVVDGRAVTSSVHEMLDARADLLVMATHRRNLLGRIWWGSIAHSLMQRIKTPMVLVRDKKKETQFTRRAMQRLMLPWGGRNESAAVLDHLLKFGLFAGAQHSLVHVVRPMVERSSRWDAGEVLDGEPIPRDNWIDSLRKLYPVAQALREDGRDVQTKIMVANRPARDVLLGEMRGMDADIVALPYVPQPSISRMFNPSVSEFLFHRAHSSLMFVPVDNSHGRESR